MASNFLQLNDRISQGEGAPVDGDAISTSITLFPIGAIYIDNNTGILYARNTANGNAADWVSSAGGGGGIDDVLAEGQSLTADREVELDGWDWEILNDGRLWAYMKPETGENYLQSFFDEGDGNNAVVGLVTGTGVATVSIYGSFNDGDQTASIILTANTTEALAEYKADKHKFLGITEHADNDAALLAGLEEGMLYRTGDLLKIVH